MGTIISSIVQVERPVPFAPSLYWWLQLNNLQLQTIVNHSRHYEPSYLAWETVRKIRNPFFDIGTGFEGYFIGMCHSPGEVLENILHISSTMLHSIYGQYRMDYGFKSRLMKTLTGEMRDTKAVSIWASEFGAATARLRCNLQRNIPADIFRIETYHIVRSLAPICYYEREYAIFQSYSLGHTHHQYGKIHVDLNILNPSDQDAWVVAWSIGRFGHPMVRAWLYERQY
jgi:hypothetical protein